MATFVNRERELNALESWWSKPAARLGLVWGRRRVGKTALIQRFATGRATVFHTAGGRPAMAELRLLSRAAAGTIEAGIRDLEARPFADWDDALETLAASRRPVLLVLDEFPELLRATPELPTIIRAFWDRVRTTSKLRLLLCGSAVRVMHAVQEERSPLFGRADLSLLVHPFGPHEASGMLRRLSPADRALVWGIVGGVPLYLEWWDTTKTIGANLADLVCTPGGPLLNEGAFVLATEGDDGDLGRLTLHAIATGRTKHNEIADAIGADPTRVLERLTELGLIERLVPVTEDPRRTRRRVYRIADNFLAFWLGIVDRHRAEIERGLGRSILPVMRRQLDEHLGPRWEEAFRAHLRLLSETGALGPDIVAIGPFWSAAKDPAEIDAVALAGRGRQAVLVGEAKWAKSVDGEDVRRTLERKAAALPRVAPDVRFAVAARERVSGSGLIKITASDIF